MEIDQSLARGYVVGMLGHVGRQDAFYHSLSKYLLFFSLEEANEVTLSLCQDLKSLCYVVVFLHGNVIVRYGFGGPRVYVKGVGEAIMFEVVTDPCNQEG